MKCRFYAGILMEARVGIEPTHKGCADLSLTTWVPRPGTKNSRAKHRKPSPIARDRWSTEIMERETGFEPATSTLARSHSTAELLPLRTGSIITKQHGHLRIG